MTAARRERKSCRRIALSALIVLAVLAGPAVVRAAVTEWVVVNRHTGLAIDGFDPVAYFTDGAPREGRPELEVQAAGVTWRFCSEGNRAAFAAAPEVYAPRFGGYDPTSVGRGASAPGHPSIWLVVERRLYLFYNDDARDAFARDPDGAIEAAERNWPAVRRTLVRD
jgi:YHS domain-containing protein